MKNDIAKSRSAPDRHRAKLRLRAGKRVSLTLQLDVSSGGLFSIGVLVSSILLSTAIVVRSAKTLPFAAADDEA
ncbi:hypothetical protein [Sphingomonas montana]|uniref:hypothetical protein n=1 Tax=Sphingomonas montana TaxID=1843236 RepID=UPI00101AE32E|nr:hypothetical protein [Sphingomonas montana]